MPGWRFWIDREGTFTDFVARAMKGDIVPRQGLRENPERCGDAAIAGMRDRLDLSPTAPLPPGAARHVRMGTTHPMAGVLCAYGVALVDRSIIRIQAVEPSLDRDLVLLGAVAPSASSQATMNNLLFDGARRQYDETICGGAGAGPGFDGATAVQTHMTNCGSGGAGRWDGGRTAIGGRDDGAPS
jgi:N-methylhydantoinase A/oxoprolinase/acetone carboxylase beta subunit